MLDPQGIMKVLTDRRAIYAAKRDKKDPFAEDSHTDWDLHNHAVEAFDYAIAEMAREIGAEVER